MLTNSHAFPLRYASAGVKTGWSIFLTFAPLWGSWETSLFNQKRGFKTPSMTKDA
jgi:hypothetical protein